MEKINDVKPVLKWVGGKRQLLNDILPLINFESKKYVEPFIGGGAVLFEIQHPNAVMNDYNPELINVYIQIKENPTELINFLKIHSEKNSEEYFYKIRSLDRSIEFKKLNEVEKAARIIFLNKTCYNGLFRVNSLGQYNSPYGKYKNPNIVNEETILALSNYFNKNKVKIMCGDYKEALKGLRKDSFVYFDPPYMPISSSSSFTGYTNVGFDYSKQKELRDECIKLHKKGIQFVQSNSYCDEILELYSDKSIFKIKEIYAKRSINSNSKKRGAIKEVLIYNETQEK